MMQPVSSPAVRCRKDFDGLAVRWPGEVRVGTMTAALRQDQLAQALKRSILAYRLLIIDGHQPLATRPRVRSEQRFYSVGYAH